MSRKWSKHQYYQIFIFNTGSIIIGEVHISFLNDQVYFYQTYTFVFDLEKMQNHVTDGC
jgi:hypothetical protein